jgi:hypothetical protein
VLWATTYYGPADSDRPYALAVDDSGNVYVTGESMDMSPYVDYATIKYDSLGSVAWIQRYHGPAEGWHAGRDIALDDSGNVYVTGYSEGGATGYDFATIKYVENSAPEAFSLLSPPDDALLSFIVIFEWEDAIDPDPLDEVRYDLYVSHSPSFHPDSTAICSNLSGSNYTASFDIGTYYWKVKAYDDYAETWSTQTWNFNVFVRGDANGDGVVAPADVVYLINYFFRGDLPPDPLEAGDANCDGVLGPGDVVYLINYLFRSGDPPGCG